MSESIATLYREGDANIIFCHAAGSVGNEQADRADELMVTEPDIDMAPVPRTSTMSRAVPPSNSSSEYTSIVEVLGIMKPGTQAVMDAVGGNAGAAAPADNQCAGETPLSQQFLCAPGL